MRLKTRCIAGLRSHHAAELELPRDFAFERVTWARRSSSLRMSTSTWRRRSISNGLVMYSRAPSLMASTALSTAAYPVMSITSQPGTEPRICRSRSRPLTSGIRRSTIARSAGLCISAFSASVPLAHVITSYPTFAARRSITFRTGISSSTTSNCGRASAGLSMVKVAVAGTRGHDSARPGPDDQPLCADSPPGVCAGVRYRTPATRQDAIRRIVELPGRLYLGIRPQATMTPPISSVLIVDDEPAIRDLMSVWVKSLGLQATTAANADEALATLRGARYDLAVVDVLMPGRDGLWLATEMQRDHPYTAVIIATAYTELLGPDAPQPDIADVLVKPFQRDRFALALQRGREWRKQALKELQWHSVLSKELRERTGELCAELKASRGNPPAIEWLTAVMDERAPAVLEHGARVARYAAAVAREMSLERGAIGALELAARFHDAGKAAMPEALLSKPSPLSPGERAIMRRHVEVGADILKCAPALAPIAPLVLASHEWFGGGGYPKKLAGEAIPLASRIIAVVDAYDTMTDTRHDQAFGAPAGAVSELLRCGGTQFDPDALDAFLAVLGRH